MAAYLLNWDPTKWDWRTIKEQSEQVARGAPVVRPWSCGSNRRIFNGDVVYFMRQGREPRGLFARGEVVRGAYEAMNAEVQDANRGKPTLVIDVRFNLLENAVERVVLPRQVLTGGGLGKFVWDTRESGSKIPDAVATALDVAWSTATGAKSTEKPVSTPTREKASRSSPAPSAPENIPVVAQAPDDAVGNEKKASQPQPVVPEPEQEQLKLEREARLQKIRDREAQERRDREAATRQEDAPPVVTKPSSERRNEILVQNYFIMLDAELQGELYSKADHRNRIMKELGASDADTVDRMHRHISAILAETGLPFADGFPPEAGFDAELEKAVHVFIEANPELLEALWIEEVPPASSIPVELDDPMAHWAAPPEPSGFQPSGRSAWHPAGVSEIDYRVRESWNRNLSVAGERFVLAFERARLREAGLKDSIDKVAWQSQTFGDSFGYDIRSFEDDGRERIICVKTTNYGARFPFHLTHRELQRARENPDHFYVYRVFRLFRNAKLFVIPAGRLMRENLESVVFRSWI